ncbi:uncharacterized protein LOC119766517 [Culex quinquefasciatus]|uniref:uncharacterized protein LOC119766517 n=2 Tax=Culex quinquefasciatus TaxID=7176 RepID=UPI0018E35324|nr:uncharacterized protein LOC119766517 [Culex quinquefasciatus]XP_039446109.1 uncharacterized protein LOC120425593 [Culex pipiens pallens]XP_052566204.1 uncharacterized protein LOC120425593 [Culex pipiens pallens]
MKIPLILFWAWVIQADMQLYDLNTNPGVVMLRSGRRYIKEGNIRIYHKIDLQAYGPLIVRCRTAINSLKTARNYKEVIDLLSHRVEKIMNMYRDLYPKEVVRRKRALDFLGTGIKFITGNMDSDDRAQIKSDIDTILNKEEDLVKQNNKQIVINKQLETRVNKMIRIINDQQNNAILQLNDFNILKQTIIATDHLNQIEGHLDSIAETIHLAKFNIISKSFLEPEEIGLVQKTLIEQDVALHNVNQIYDFLEIKVAYLQSNLFFVILVPRLKQGTFKSYLLAAIPKNGKIIQLPAPDALVGGNQTYFIRQHCAGGDSIVVCNEEDLIDVSGDNCFDPIFRGSTGDCVFTNYSSTSRVRRLTDNHILLNSGNKTKLSSTCGLPDRNLSGNVLIFFENCTVQINDEIFKDVLFNTREKIDIIPLNGQIINEGRFNASLSLQNVHELHLAHREWLESIERKATATDSRNIGIFFVFSCLFSAMFVAKVCARRTKLKDGGVTDARHHPSHHARSDTHTCAAHTTDATTDATTAATADTNTSLERGNDSRKKLKLALNKAVLN